LQPALAIAEALAARGHGRETIEFVGSRRGQDAQLLSGRGFPVTLLPGRGIARSLRPRMLWRNLGAVVGLAVATVQAAMLVARARPRVVVSVGGYASVAASVVALASRVPLVLVNVDAVPGAANRLFGRAARACAVGWPGTPLPRSVVTGTPVRPEISALAARAADRLSDQSAARIDLGIPPGRATVAVFGGSLGARRINTAATELAALWAGRDDRSIYHIVGRRDWEASSPSIDGLVRVPYQDHMELVYTAADVVVCRAGAMTVAELAVVGVPSVLVPLPDAPHDHQWANARVLERAGAAVLVPDAECDGARLERLLDGLLADRRHLASMAAAAAGMGRPDAADAGARLVETQAKSVPKQATPGNPRAEPKGSA
jgi:UDP-N-acetylglucosamine:LPS N-acetylglucosamine transferase